MEQSSVLSLDSIDRIRFYVKRKYAHLPQEKHAEIVADAIVKIIERQLPNYDTEIKKIITNQLIADVIIPQKRPVSIEDIERTCHVLATSNEDKQLLLQWKIERGIEKQVDHPFRALHIKLSTYFAKHKLSLYYGIASLLLIAAVSVYGLAFPTNQTAETTEMEPLKPLVVQSEVLMENELPASYQYTLIDNEKLKSYLGTRDSILADEPYFDTIMATAKSFNIHPLLLFAITGQEQGFVSRDHENALQIANNPFNVFYSWEDYNTSIEDTTAIAARTIVNLSKDRPADIDPIVWINRKYAEDPNWSTGVKSLFSTMVNYIND